MELTRYSIEPRIIIIYVKGCRFLLFSKNVSKPYKKQILDTRLDALKTAFKKIVCKVVGETSEFIGNKTASAVNISKNDKIMNIDESLRNFEEIVVWTENKKKY